MTNEPRTIVKKANRIENYEKIECSLILIDLSGFTQLLYHASYSEKIMRTVVLAMKKMFQDAMLSASAARDIQIINTTGDGFIAIAIGDTPSRTAVKYVEQVRIHFVQYVSSIVNSVPFRQKVDLRIALHHGSVYRMEIADPSGAAYPLYLGDDINLIARVINGQVARRYGVAITKHFLRRLMLQDKSTTPDEVIVDRNRYPEQIDIYRLPDRIPEYVPAKKRKA